MDEKLKSNRTISNMPLQLFATITDLVPINQGMLLQALILLAVIAFSTRLITGLIYSPGSSSREGTRRIDPLAYWIPHFGHLLPLTLNPSHFLQKCRCVARGILLRPNVDCRVVKDQTLGSFL